MTFLTKRMGTMLNLTACPGGRSFITKYVLLPTGYRIVLGRELREGDSGSGSSPRTADASNGWFASEGDSSRSALNGTIKDSDDLPLSPAHAELWAENGQVYIKDLNSKHGTFVNDVRITGATLLESKDIVVLGVGQIRSESTPEYVTDEDLKPVIAKVNVVGGSSK